MLIGIESYTTAKRRLKGAEKGIKHQKDTWLRPDKVRQEEDAKMDKSHSAEKERQHLAALEAEQEKARTGDKYRNGRFSRLIGRLEGWRNADKVRRWKERRL